MKLTQSFMSLACVVVAASWVNFCACSGDASLGYDKDASADGSSNTTMADVVEPLDSTNSDSGHPNIDEGGSSWPPSSSPIDASQGQDSPVPESGDLEVRVDAAPAENSESPDTGSSEADSSDAPNGDSATQDEGATDAGTQGDDASCTFECFRAPECVSVCGGPMVLGECCSCPAGMFDQVGGCSVVDAADTEGGPDAEGADGASCETAQCVHAFQCATSCDGPELTNGCCPCPAGMIDWTTCESDAQPPPPPPLGLNSACEGDGGGPSVGTPWFCPSGLTVITFYGITSAEFCMCGIPCAAGVSACPSTTTCMGASSDGPPAHCDSLP